MELGLLYISLIVTISESAAFDLDSAYYTYEPLPFDTVAPVTEEPRALDTIGSEPGKLRISGAKDFSFDVKQGFDQGLNVDITGEVEGVGIEGNLSDKATPSSTVRISEVERVSLRAFTKNFSGGIGNLTLDLPFGIRDEIQGGEIGIHTADRKSGVNAAYATNRGTYTRTQFPGEEGKQSPYFLEGPVIAGSERVYLTQGIARPVVLNRETDYNIDYESGIISFTNNNIITTRTRIEVEYQRAIEDYLNTYRQANGILNAGPIKIRGLYRISSDERNNPLTFTLNPAERESLSMAGDSASVLHTYADTSSEGNYVLEDDHFVYVGQGNGTHNVNFFYVGEGNGDYIYDPMLSAFSYQGAGFGNYTPTKTIPLPRREEFYGLSTEFYKTLTLFVYGSRVDRNTFSSIDDQDNSGLGYRALLDRSIGFASIKCDYIKYEDEFISPSGREEVDYRHIWNTTEPMDELADFSIGLAPTDYFRLNVGYGFLNRQYRRRSLTIEPFFFLLGFEGIDSLTRYFAGFTKNWTRLTLAGRYEKYGEVHMVNYRTQYMFGKTTSIGLNGSYDKDSLSTGVMNTLRFSTTPLTLTIGHRSVNDTNFYFGNAAIRYTRKGLSLFGDLQQTQRYSQRRDDAYIKVDEGQGDYVYDPVTGTYIRKENGDYIRKIFLLPDFIRVITRNYGFEIGYATTSFDANGRFYYVDERDFRSHTEDFSLNVNSAGYDVTMNLRQNIQDDARYALGMNSIVERSAALVPSIDAFAGRIEIRNATETVGEYEKERRSTYRAEISYDVLRQPIVRPKAGYAYSMMRSQYFAELDVRQHAPKTGILVSVPFKRIRGKIEATADFTYRIYNIEEIPFFFTANEARGLTTILGANTSFGVGANTVFNLIYRVEFRKNERPNQNFRLQSRIRF
ncbi:MAG: hypothetical protein JSU64_04135 [candidate division WOR-3 bacterium]|nr:MAG: hypothetical protein JSU64_04135 [candidate division WOR-3 bacterium]